MNKKIIKKMTATLLTAGTLMGVIAPFSSIQAFALGLPIPTGKRPTLETTFTPENIWKTMTSDAYSGYAITGSNTIKQSGKLYSSSNASVFPYYNGDVLGANGIGFLTDVVQVDTGATAGKVLFLKEDGSVWLSNTTNSRYNPQKIEGISDVVQIVNSGYTYYFLKEDKTVWFMGINEATGSSVSTITQLEGISDVVSIETYANTLFAITSTGDLYSYGYNSSEAHAGVGNTTARISKPTKIMEDVVKVSDGYKCAIALKTDGSVWGWGSSSALGSQSTNLSPIQVWGPEKNGFLTDIVDIANVYGNFLAVRNDGAVYSWGNTGLYHGHPISYAISSPTLLEGIENAVGVFGDQYTRYILTTEGTLYGWGENKNGNLGVGHSSPVKTPVEITFDGQNKKQIIPANMMYNFTSPEERVLYEGNKVLPVSFELVSDEVVSFDLYYAPFESWDDQLTWVEIEKGVPVSNLSPEKYTSTIKGEDSSYLEGTKYTYNWTLPNDFLAYIKIIAVPTYK